jgi:hypothetical protein|tara:strand:+ start:1618 stop:2379 length:762 start_codon:yes stop_codon:yes gene_type:complete
MSNRFGLSDSLLDAVKDITSKGPSVDKNAAFGLTEMSSKEKMKKGLYNGKMDPVGKADADIDNDGDVDDSDEYLKNRRKAISKNAKKGGVEINPEMKEEVEQVDELKKSTLSSYIKKAAGQVSGASRAAKDFERDAERKRSPRKKDTDNRIAQNFRKTSIKRRDGIGKAADKLAKEETKVDSGLENPHNCATHVYSESWGDGRTVTTMHAEPDAAGNIAWYDVMFEHGIEKGVPIEEMKVVKSESHMHSKKKG